MAKRKGSSRSSKPSDRTAKRKDSPPASAETDKENESLPETCNDGQPAAGADRFPVVGIGASAGGLEALQEFFRNMPDDSGMAFVVVTHQHPGHVSMLASLLSKKTRMPVIDVRDGVRVESNRVYVVPPEPLSISDGILRILPPDTGHLPHLPIDSFFRSLAADQRECAICVILSGTGADGTAGLRAVKAELGMAMVQEPPSAKYGGMPASAMETGLADYIVPAAAMPEQLMAYARGPYLKPHPPTADSVFPREPLQRIFTMLRVRTGHDFASYKETTIRRRIERRMNVHQIKEAPAYVRYLQENPHEIDLLFGELLISVTNFFRDADAFAGLREKALPELLQVRDDSAALRVWVPGCATGEEAYSLAILFCEAMEKSHLGCSIQFFGTDLDARAIETARAGVYPGSISADVSKERLERFFTHENNTYRVKKELRERLIFAPHDLIKDPPFTKLDLIACRNLLIYLDGDAQRRLLPMFHYALRPGGLLFLGPSETVGGATDLFETLDAKWRIYRRKETVVAAPPMGDLSTAISHFPAPHDAPPPLRQGSSHTSVTIERVLLARFAPTAIVVTDTGGIVYIHGRTGAYLEPSEGQPRNNVLEMARPGLARPLNAALRQAIAEKREVVRGNVAVKTNGDFTAVDISVTPLEGPGTLRGLFLVSIVPTAVKPQPAAKQGNAKQGNVKKVAAGRVEELEQEVRFTKESLQTTIEEMETSNEELKSTNEELQSTNEELQSANEELETSKEELQSLNEELSTVNSELQAKVEELSQASNDMQNLLNNTDVAMIFLDEQLRVKRFTEAARRLVNLIPGDVGRPLSDLASKLEYANLVDDCRAVLRDLMRKEAEIRTGGDSWHIVRIMPYRTAENMIDGVVLTFQDIGGPKRVAAAVREFFEGIVQTIREPLVVLDDGLCVQFANDAFFRRFEFSRKAVERRSIFDLARKEWSDGPFREKLEAVVRDDAPIQDLKIEAEFPEIGAKRLLLNARRIGRGAGEPAMVLLTLEEA